MKKKSTIGVVAICFNEEIDILNFLYNVTNWSDEIVIVDSGSTDKTVDIIKSFPSKKIKLVRTKFNSKEGYSGLRNLGLSNSTTDWVLNMDIDERTTPDFISEIKKNICNKKYNGFKYKRQNHFLHRPMIGGGWNSWNNPQLGRRSSHYYHGKVHEQCIIDGGDLKTGQLKSKIIHLNDDGYKERMKKSFNYCQVEAEKLIEKKTKVYYFHFIYFTIKEFFKKYFIRYGFLDGTAGLISAIHSSNATFRKLAIVWDKQNEISRSEIEKSISDKWEKQITNAHTIS